MKKIYVLGFAFNDKADAVLLIEKTHPAWQKGLLNGIGGVSDEADGDLFDTMVREFKEETGIQTVREDWCNYGEIFNKDGSVVILFRTFNQPIRIAAAATQPTEEKLVLFEFERTKEWPSNVIENLPTLICAALDWKVDHYTTLNYQL